MQDLLNQLQRTKMALVSLVLVVVGILLIALQPDAETWNVSDWIRLFPFDEVGGILIGAGLLSIWIDHLFRREQQASDEIRLRRLLTEQAPIMRDAVLHAFAANTPDLKRVATPDTLDDLVANSLALRLRDEQFAHEIFADIRDQAINAVERWHELNIDVHLSEMPNNPDYFTALIRWEYTTIPRHAVRRFTATSDRDEYDQLASLGSDTTAW